MWAWAFWEFAQGATSGGRVAYFEGGRMKHKIKEFPEWKAEVLELLEGEWYITDITFDFEGLFEREKRVRKAVEIIAYDNEVAKQMNKRLIVMDFRKGKVK